ncbi:coiled-coil domain-containing protein 138 isoform X10 [Gopherus flavomarginatus]|uniref:coiled-coil domain-containing protein 138 isoform X10 n=1 Tax=Gopherus flavomarginatus TaxID=286002 RepID=UPI0021CBE668|nr:coiled-coil domain-containing protein 138 isoform X10 [Gopherus flavomarginatus]
MASPALSGSVERLKRRYLRGGARPAGDCLSGSLQTKCKKGNSLTNTGNLDSSSDNTIMPLSIHFSQSRSTQNGRKHYSKPLSDLFKSFKNLDCFDDELDSLYDSSQLELEEEVMNVSATDAVPNTVTYTYTETDVTLPSNLAANTVTFSDHDINSGLVRKIVSKPETQVLSGQRLIPSHINQIYDELYDIHQKLQQENSAQQEYALQLQKREHFLAEREALLFKHEAALTKIRGVEEEVHAKFQIIKEGPLNSHVYELLTVLMDWISDQFLKVKIEEEGRDNQTLTYTHKNYTQEKCAKLLPIVAEQLQWMPFVNPKLHMPVIKFIYWAIRQLNCGTQHSTMTSTMRRLGEDIFKGIGTKGNQHGSSEQPAESKPKIAAFFKSSILPLRFVSTLIVLKTVTQGLTKGTKHLTRGRIRKQDFSNVKGGKFLADYLAQAFDSLCVDLKTDEGKALFLEYQSVPVILSHLRISNRGLLSNAIDGLLQMTMESGFLQPFLEACSNESFFRTCSVLLRNPKLDLLIVEKLSIILQKLSRIKSNKKMFELFTIHLMIQELQRTTHPNHAFLCINLNSILFNLGLTRTNSLISSLSTSH